MPETSAGPRRAGTKKTKGTDGDTAEATPDDTGVTISVAGETYTATEPHWRIAMALHQQTDGGLNWLVLCAALDDPMPPPFILAGFIFIAKAQAGEPESYEAIADRLTYDVLLEGVVPIEAEPAPEGPGSD